MRKFRDQRVLLTGDPVRLRTDEARLMLRVAANLISRFCLAVDVSLGEGLEGIDEEIQELIQSIERTADVRRVPLGEWGAYAAILSVGPAPRISENTVSIAAAGWLAVVSHSGSLPPVAVLGDGNPFGAMAAAALGAAEVFKHLVKPHSERAGFYGDTTFSTFDYSVGRFDPGPELPRSLVLSPSLLAGVGAVGTAFLMALREVPDVKGELVTVDKECLDDPSNLNRYSLAREEDVRPEGPLPKTALATRAFAGTSVSIREVQKEVKEMTGEIERGTIRRPQVILCALDNNPSRHELQDLWPDLLLEGATGGTVLQVSRCQYEQGLACLRCLHPLQEGPKHSYEERIRELSGLPLAWIAAAVHDPSLPLTADVVAQAPATTRECLLAHIGKQACGVLADIESLSTLAKEKQPVEPAVSFVSMMSGVLMAAEYVKKLMGAHSTLKTFFQADLMFPLEMAILQTVKKSADCYCVRRKDVIARYRQEVQATQVQAVDPAGI
jgi:molybdopterin/thiamine biosynthesis adenylyltransferase